MNNEATKAKLATLNNVDLRYLAFLVDLEFRRRGVEPSAAMPLASTSASSSTSPPRSKRIKHL